MNARSFLPCLLLTAAYQSPARGSRWLNIRRIMPGNELAGDDSKPPACSGAGAGQAGEIGRGRLQDVRSRAVTELAGGVAAPAAHAAALHRRASVPGSDRD